MGRGELARFTGTQGGGFGVAERRGLPGCEWRRRADQYSVPKSPDHDNAIVCAIIRLLSRTSTTPDSALHTGWVFRDVERIERARPILREVSLRVGWRERVAIEGPSGSGKTTLLRLLPRLDDADAGEIRLDGLRLAEHDPRSLRRCVRYVPQNPVPLPGSVADNFECAAGFARVSTSRSEMVSLLVGLALDPDILDVHVARLSGGELHRVAIGRALIAAGSGDHGTFFVLDEPTAHLDVESARTMLGTVAAAGGLLVADHHGVALDVVDRVVRIERGGIVDDRASARRE